MYIENVCLNHVTTDYNVYTPQYQPQNNTKEESYGFKDLLTETINVTAPQYQTYSTYSETSIAPAVSASETESTYVGAPAVSDPVAYTPAVYTASAHTPVDNTPASNTPAVNAPVSNTPTGNTPSVNHTYPMNSIPPVIKTQEASETDYISKYYPIPESQVIPKIIEVRQIINSTDMSGKTDVEKYSFIEGRFADAFGSDFMMARNLFLPSSMFYMIGVEFNDTLGRFIENPEQVNRQRLHGDASTEAIQNNIRNNFPTDLTNREMVLMVNQMRNEGVLDVNSVRSLGAEGARRLMDTLEVMKNYIRYSIKSDNAGGLGQMSLAERDRRWINLLDKPVNLHQLLCTFNVWAQYGRVDIDPNAAPFISRHIGGEIGPNGLFIVDAPSSGDTAWWNNFFDMLFEEFAEYDDMIRSRMDMINGEYNMLAGANTEAAGAASVEANSSAGETAGVEAAGYAAGETDGAKEVFAAGEADGADAGYTAEDSSGAEESAGAEENLDSGDSGDSGNSGESGSSSGGESSGGYSEAA